jgi:alpha-beta hydrolase superfamily lysophospholipase
MRATKLAAVATVLIGLGSCASAIYTAPTPAVAVAGPQIVTLPASQGRELQLMVWRMESPKAVVVFSAGGGGRPTNYESMLSALAARGFSVVAPVHDDPLARGDLSGDGGPASFAARVEDLALARGYAQASSAGAPMVVMGHSFGSMMSSLAIGARTPAGPQADPAVKGLIAFSTPGLIPGLVTADAYTDLNAPVLLVTGDRDVVPGFVTDWRDHRAVFDRSRAPGSILVVVPGGDHNLIASADRALLDVVATFIDAHAAGDPSALERLARLEIDGATTERR